MVLRVLIFWLLSCGAVLAADVPAPFRDCADCPPMVTVPAGSFTMGSDVERRAWRPAHTVVIEKPFAIAVHETTWDEYLACVSEGACREPVNDHGWGRSNRPVIKVTIRDAYAYADWLSEHTGQVYRLPSEAEWEYAARAGTTTRFWWGDAIAPDQANCYHCLSDPEHHGSLPVGTFAANPWGLVDVHGNLSEWVADCWRQDYVEGKGTQAAYGGEAPAGTDPRDFTCRERVTRSGDWYYKPSVATSAARQKYFADQGSYLIGFRVVRDVSE